MVSSCCSACCTCLLRERTAIVCTSQSISACRGCLKCLVMFAPLQVRDHLRAVTLEALAEGSPRGREAVELRRSAKQDLERCK